jgi:glycosyltransferase involved in cell wall biosynthesis
MNSESTYNNVRAGISDQYFFSVVITTFNRSELISRALNSLIAQTEPDWEAIIVDDGSTDDTHASIAHYLEKYPGILFKRQKHRGEPAAKNNGLKSASGKFVTFLDSDDEFDPRHLELRKTVLLQNPSVKFLYGGVKIIGDPWVPDRFNHQEKVNLNNCIIGGTFFIERSTALSLNGFTDIAYGTDAELYDRASDAAIPMMEISFPTYIYHHETVDSITNRLAAGL